MLSAPTVLNSYRYFITFQLSQDTPSNMKSSNQSEKFRQSIKGRKSYLVLPQKKLSELRNLVLELDNNLSAGCGHSAQTGNEQSCLNKKCQSPIRYIVSCCG